MLNNEKPTFNDIVYHDISKMSKLGEEKFKAFWMDRLMTCQIPVSDPILLNLLNLPGNPNKQSNWKRSCFDSSDVGEIWKVRRSTKWISWTFSAHWGIWNSSRLVCKPIVPLSRHVTSQFRAISKPSFHVTKSRIAIELSMLLRMKECSGWKISYPYSRCDILTDR